MAGAAEFPDDAGHIQVRLHQASPIFCGDIQNVVGILYAKDLILLDPDDEIEIGAVVSFR